MKVSRKESALKMNSVQNIPHGGCFLYGGELLMRIEVLPGDVSNGVYIRAVEMRIGSLVPFNGTEVVEPVMAVVTY